MIQVKKKNQLTSCQVQEHHMGVGGSRKNKREGVVMDLMAHSFALTHISLKYLFTKK